MKYTATMERWTPPSPRFSSGQIVSTPGAIAAFQSNYGDEWPVHPLRLLARHLSGDWGEVDADDAKENELSVRKGFRVLSAYRLPDRTRVWLITEADRSVTTFLLPEEY